MKNNFFVSVLLLSSMIVGVLLFELILRIENSWPDYPKFSYKIEGVNYSFHNDVADALNDSAQPSTKKIWVLGDSFVAGAACAAEKSNLTGHLQKKSSVKVVNLGVDGKNPANYIDFLSYMPLHPGDTVAVVLYDNDIHLSKEACEITKRQSKHFNLYYPKLCEDYLTGLENPKNEQGILALINRYLKDFAVIKVVKEALYQTPLAKIYYRQDFQNRWLKIDEAENRWIVSAIEVMKSIVEKKGGGFCCFTTLTLTISKQMTQDTRCGLPLD